MGFQPEEYLEAHQVKVGLVVLRNTLSSGRVGLLGLSSSLFTGEDIISLPVP